MKNGFLLSCIITIAFMSNIAHAGLEDGLVCDAADLLMTKEELKTKTIYRKNSWGVCVETDGTAENNYENHFFRDAQCNSEIDFHRRPDISNVCIDYYNQSVSDPDPITFGNAASWTPDVLNEDPLNGQFDSKKWTVSRGTRYSSTLFNTSSHNIPFMKKIAYREVGECKLEMRVYKKDMDATNLKPMLFLHGGSYESHLGLLPMEAEVSHFTEEGYLVFIPFYRLANNLDAVGWGANLECRDVLIDSITSDVQAAMEFVVQNGPSLGTNGNKVDVFGQSAGGTLATWLALSSTGSFNGISLKNWINRLVLIYPALDMRQFAEHALVEADDRAVEILVGAFDLSIEVGDNELSEDDKSILAPFAMNNLVQAETSSLPPIFMMHGLIDPLVPISGSTSFCDAYAEKSTMSVALCTNDLTNTIDGLLDGSGISGKITECNCGPNISRNGTTQTSIFHKISEAGHGYDTCIGSNNINCENVTETMSEQARNAARASWSAMLEWLAQED